MHYLYNLRFLESILLLSSMFWHTPLKTTVRFCGSLRSRQLDEWSLRKAVSFIQGVQAYVHTKVDVTCT